MCVYTCVYIYIYIYILSLISIGKMLGPSGGQGFPRPWLGRCVTSVPL